MNGTCEYCGDFLPCAEDGRTILDRFCSDACSWRHHRDREMHDADVRHDMARDDALERR